MVINPYDSSLDYETFCKRVFGNNRCLAMRESKNGQHLHIQGELAVSDEEYVLHGNQLRDKHYRKKEDPNSRPVKRRRVAADDKGFQYMAKDLPNSVVVYKQQFTDDDIAALHAASVAHVDEQKGALGEHLREQITDFHTRHPPTMWAYAMRSAYRYYMDRGVMRPPNLKALVEFALTKHFPSDDLVEFFVQKLE